MSDIALVIGIPLVLGFLFISYCAVLEFTGWVKDGNRVGVPVPVRTIKRHRLTHRLSH